MWVVYIRAIHQTYMTNRANSTHTKAIIGFIKLITFSSSKIVLTALLCIYKAHTCSEPSKAKEKYTHRYDQSHIYPLYECVCVFNVEDDNRIFV